MRDAERVERILDFWFGEPDDPQGNRRVWFVSNPEFDAACTREFLADQEQAASGQLEHWKDEPRGTLALILLLDQFPRNLFRGSARAFATDSKARLVARYAVERGFDRALRPVERPFVYLPFEHSESIADQEESLRLFRALAQEAPETAGYVQFAEAHRETIGRFGRFPLRNALLGRPSTPEEIVYIAESAKK